MKAIETSLPGVLLIDPGIYRDRRGAFAECWRLDRYAELGITDEFVQDNVSWSSKGVLRGLHYQHPQAQSKLITALYGTIYDVAVDVRPDSASFGRWTGIELVSESLRQLYIPIGFAHGFLVTSDYAVVSYKCSNYYAPEHERSIRWNDPEIGIAWPNNDPILSEKDAAAPLLRDLAHYVRDRSVLNR